MALKTLYEALYRAFLSPAKAKKTYSQCGEDAVLMHLFAGQKTPGFYVDVGCHSPRRGSNTYAFYQRGWRGILIDMEPAKVLACKLARLRDTTVLAAVSDRKKKVDIYSPSNFSVLATIRPSEKEKTYQRINTVETQTLTEILDRFKAPKRFDLLCIDAEGADLDVLRGLNFSTYKPKLIAVEVHLDEPSLSHLGENAISNYLLEMNYAICSWAGSTVIFRSESAGAN